MEENSQKNRSFSDIITKNPLFNNIVNLTTRDRLRSEEFCWDSTESALNLHVDPRTNLFLSIAGLNQNYLQSKSKHITLYIAHICWNIFIITVSLGCYLLFVAEFFIFSDERNLLNILIASSSMIQALSLCFATYFNIKRLQSPAELLEIPHYKEAFTSTMMMLFFFILTTVPVALTTFPFEHTLAEIFFSIMILTCFIGQSFLFSVSGLFIFVDVEACKQLLLLAIEKQKQNALTISLLNKVRDEINYRVEKSSWTNNVLLITATYYLLAIVASLFINRELIKSLTFRVIVVGLMFREIGFLFASFWEAAKVNELADAFLQTLSHTVAEVGMILERPTEKFISVNETIDEGVGEGEAEKISKEGETSSMMESYRDEEMGRLKLNMKKFSIFMNVSGDPISFKLAGLRLSRKDILVRFGLWLIGLIIGLFGQL